MPYTRSSRTPFARLFRSALALACLLTVGALTARAQAIISNGTIQMGVNQEGHLNVFGGTPSSGGTTAVGLRYLPTNSESTAPGCLCEGWGAADTISNVSGYANVSVDGGPVNLTLVSFTSNATEATSVVDVGSPAVMRVTHYYHPSAATPNLYQVDVKIENISGSPINVLYRRVMDWDIEPTPFSEFVTIQRGTAVNIIRTDNNGFNSGNPFSFFSFGLLNVDFTDNGPSDHGALFDFDFGMLAPGADVEFKTYYGAAGNEAGALSALAAVAAEAYSFGQTNFDPTGGTPNTFIFAFGEVGGDPIVGPTANAGPDQTVECAGASTPVTLDGTASVPPSGGGTIDSYEWYEGATLLGTGAVLGVSLPAGSHTITLKITGSNNVMHSDDVVINIVDTTAPTISASVPSSCLWPPNHELINAATIAVGDSCGSGGAVSASIAVTSDENPELSSGGGDGHHSPDAKVVNNADGSYTVRLRAERLRKGDGRVYLIHVKAVDGAGNVASQTLRVDVPENQSSHPTGAPCAVNSRPVAGGNAPDGGFIALPPIAPLIGPKQ